jgi:antirestriction protein ArdC
MANKLYSEITNAILTELEKGGVPWRKDWRSTASAAIPHNVISKRPYSGVNVILLWLKGQQRGWSSMEFLTFKQAAEAGGTVRHGEKSVGIVFVKQLQVPDRKEPDKVRLVPMLRAYRVFHVSQCESLPESLTKPLPKAPRNHDRRSADIDEFMTSTGADIREGFGEPAYSLANDVITVPHFSDFATADGFYSTAFHELAHWTGAKHRLNRDMRSRFGDLHAYAGEELIAELCASFLAAEFSLNFAGLQHASYLDGWFKLLKSDVRAFFTAASKAQAAADYLRGLALADQPAAA